MITYNKSVPTDNAKFAVIKAKAATKSAEGNATKPKRYPSQHGSTKYGTAT